MVSPDSVLSRWMSCFPANQLVTSPTQEQAKMVFLKEQQLENMLSHMDGVIHADVTVAMPMSVDGKNPLPHTASVFIKYSPEVNLQSYQSQIKGLVRDAVPGIDYAKISVVMQPANYRFSASEAEQQQGPQTTVQWLLRHVGMVQNMVGVAFISLIVLMFVGWFYYRRR